MHTLITLERLRNLALLLAFVVGSIPFVTYITDANSGLLWLMMCPVDESAIDTVDDFSNPAWQYHIPFRDNARL